MVICVCATVVGPSIWSQICFVLGFAAFLCVILGLVLWFGCVCFGVFWGYFSSASTLVISRVSTPIVVEALLMSSFLRFLIVFLVFSSG